MKRFPTIPEYADVVRMMNIRHQLNGADIPVLTFKGAVKKEGENCSIVKFKDGTYKFYNRNTELSLDKDCQDFMNQMLSKNYQGLFDDIEFNEYYGIYGEWCGGGILSDKNMAISSIPDKIFVIFTIRIDDKFYELSEFSNAQNNADTPW